MHKIIAAGVLALVVSIPTYARNTSANHGHHGSANNGAVGAASVGSTSGSSAGSSAGSTGMGGSYWSPNLNAAPEDAYQPWPEATMIQFQKP
jgi:hypothetical protein